MAFKIAQKQTYKVTVKVSIPNDKNSFDTNEFTAEFKRINMDEIQLLGDKTNAEAMEYVLAGWSDLLDDENNQVDFNQDNVKALLNIPQALAGLREAFWGSLFKATQKN